MTARPDYDFLRTYDRFTNHRATLSSQHEALAARTGAVMHQTADVRESIANQYLWMADRASEQAADSYRQRAHRLIDLAERARRFAEQEIATAARTRVIP